MESVRNADNPHAALPVIGERVSRQRPALAVADRPQPLVGDTAPDEMGHHNVGARLLLWALSHRHTGCVKEAAATVEVSRYLYIW